MYDPNTKYTYPSILSPECFDDPNKMEKAIRDELEKMLFEYVAWDVERLLFIEENQE